MGNSINIKQNDVENMKYLFMKQYYYDSGKNKYILLILFDLLATIITIILSFIDFDIVFYYTLFSISIIFHFLVRILMRFVKTTFITASNYMDLFDNKVLDVEKAGEYYEHELMNNKDKIISKYKCLFETRISTGDKKGIKYRNWYEKVYDDEDYKSAVLYCQKQAISWTNAILYFSIVLSVVILLITSVPIVGLIKSYSIKKLILVLIAFLSNTSWLYFIMKNTINKKILVNRLKEKLEKYSRKKLKKDTLNSIEDDIYAIRKIPTIEFGFIYKMVYKNKHCE